MYDNATWFPICAGLSAVGVVAAFFAFRRKGVASGLRLLGWAVLPMAIYLTGMVRLLWTIGQALVQWVSGFVFSPFVWTGLALFAFAALVFPVAARLRRRQAGAAGASASGDGATTPLPKQGETATAAGKTRGGDKAKANPKAVGKGTQQAANPMEGMEDIEEILKRRGIS